MFSSFQSASSFLSKYFLPFACTALCYVRCEQDIGTIPQLQMQLEKMGLSPNQTHPLFTQLFAPQLCLPTALIIFHHFLLILSEFHTSAAKLLFITQFCSIDHALISMTETIRRNLNNKKYGCGVFIDLQKAFDTVNHKVLLSKLEHYGIRGNALGWFQSYLTNRMQFVSIRGKDSYPLGITCGVPQGSVLGPLLLLLFINGFLKVLGGYGN